MRNCQAGVIYGNLKLDINYIYQPPPITILLKKLPTEAGLFSNHRIESSPLKIAKHADYIIIVAEASLHYFFHAKVTKK